MNNNPSSDAARYRIDEASSWFARMRGPEADVSREEFSNWLADPQNARAFAEIEAVWSISGSARPVKSYVSLPGSQAAPQGSADRRRPWTRPALALAAIVLGAVVIALLLSGYGRSRAPARVLIGYSSNIGQIRTVALTDGSHVTLDTASRIVPAFSGRERRVVLVAGRARFSVAHDQDRPFIVIAGNRSVIARGTVFDVRLEGKALEVMLLDGKVDIEGAVGVADRPPTIRLTPGKRAVIDGAHSARVDALPRPAASWPEGMISADGMPLAEVVQEANRYSGAHVVLAEPQLGDLRVTGAFKPGNAQTLGSALAVALDLSATTQADGSVLLARKPD